MAKLASPFSHAVRRLARSPGYAAALIATLALGIAISVVAFSVLRGVVLKSLPYPEQHRVVRVASANPAQDVAGENLSPAQAETFARDADSFEAFGFFTWGGATVMHQERPLEITTNRVSAGYFPALGVRPLLGRIIGAGDIEAGEPVAVLSHGAWQRLTGGARDAVGRTLQTTNGPIEVIGVMPPEFRFPSQSVGLWRPLLPRHLDPDEPTYWNARYVDAVARLSPGTSRRAALDEMAAADVRERYGLDDTGWTVRLNPLLDVLIGDVRWVLWSVFAVSLLVLLIACANVAALVGARLSERRRQLAISLAVGATRSRLRFELALELALAALVAGSLGAAAALGLADVVAALARDHVPRAYEIGVDWPVLAFAMASALVVPLLVLALGAGAGLPGPAAATAGGYGSAGAGRGRLRLPVVGIALSTTALITASALALSLIRLHQVEPGYRVADVQALQMFRGGGPDEWRRFSAEARDRMAQLPGVERVALTTAAPQSTIGSLDADLQVPGQELPEPLRAMLRRVDGNYLPLLDIPLVAGRNFRDSDHRDAARVAIVNQTLARRAFGDLDPVGRELELPQDNTVRVVGVARDSKNAGLRAVPEPEVLVPFEQFPWVGFTFMVRTPAGLAGIEEQLRSVIWELDPEEGITREFALGEDLAAETRPLRFFTSSVAAFAVASVLLGALGVYSVLAFVQRRRVPELGVRLALGAAPSRLFGLMVAEGGRIVAFGLAGGVLGALGMLRLMQSQLFGMGGLPWAAMFAGAVIMIGAALGAALLPAWRAARINPVEALRYE